MTYTNFISRLNWRQILLHLIASIFFVHSFHSFSYLYDVNITNILQHSYGQPAEKIFAENKINILQLNYYSLWTGISGFIGLFVAFLVSLTISLRRHWFWLNSLIVLLLGYALYRLDLLSMNYVTQFRWYVAQKVNNSIAVFLIAGLILLLAGLLIFFLQKTNKFIASRNFYSVDTNNGNYSYNAFKSK